MPFIKCFKYFWIEHILKYMICIKKCCFTFFKDQQHVNFNILITLTNKTLGLKMFVYICFDHRLRLIKKIGL
jgi:hypothetical protein